MQGANLEAELADVGDILDPAALKDMLSAYVALSRVRTADGLLLLRAFSPYLFGQGPPPGPHCLMKLLRARLGDLRADPYNLEEAVAEYEERLLSVINILHLFNLAANINTFDWGDEAV